MNNAPRQGMFEILFNKLIDSMIDRYESKRRRDEWTRTRPCWHCEAAIPVKHRVCGYCGVPVQMPPSLNTTQEQVAEMDTVQVQLVPRHIRVSREKHPHLYDYLATHPHTEETSVTKPMSPLQTEPMRHVDILALTRKMDI